MSTNLIELPDTQPTAQPLGRLAPRLGNHGRSPNGWESCISSMPPAFLVIGGPLEATIMRIPNSSCRTII